jgi:hypothetical protein
VRRVLLTRATIALVASAMCAPASFGAAKTEVVKGARSYLELPIDSSGKPRPLPYVWERRINGKHILVVGTRHIFDPNSSMYPRIEKIFDRVHPQLVLHESEAPEALKTMSRDQAIKLGGDLGFVVHLANLRGIASRSADASPKQELRALLGTYSAQEVLVFLTGQRLIGNVQKPNLVSAAAEYPSFFSEYLVANGLPEKSEWQSWGGFLQAYENVIGRPLSSDTWNRDLFSPIKRTGRISDIARSTNAVRDRQLLAKIRSAMREHDRVVVIFGSWHVLALEPVLETVLAQ